MHLQKTGGIHLLIIPIRLSWERTNKAPCEAPGPSQPGGVSA